MSGVTSPLTSARADLFRGTRSSSPWSDCDGGAPVRAPVAEHDHCRAVAMEDGRMINGDAFETTITPVISQYLNHRYGQRLDLSQARKKMTISIVIRIISRS